MSQMRIGEHTIMFSTRVNAGLIHDKGYAIVVDTLLGPAEAQQIKEAVEAEGVSVDYVFNTHYHSDHTFGNCVFDAPVVTSDADGDIMRRNLDGAWSAEALKNWAKANPGTPEDFRVVVPSLTFSDAMTVYAGDLACRLQAYAGHTPGSAIAAVEADGIIFAGDLLFIGRYPYIGDGNISRWCGALRRLLRLAECAKAVVPGHGPLLFGPTIRIEITKLLTFFEDNLAVASALVAKGVSREEAVRRPEFPRLVTDVPTPQEREIAGIQKFYDEAMSWGKR